MMTSYAAPQAEPVSTSVDPTPSRSTTPHSVQPPQSSASGTTTVAHVPPSAILSSVHHHPPLQPNRHHPLPDNSWHDHHTCLKGNHIPPPRPPRPPNPHHSSHHVKVEKSQSPHSQSPHHSHPTGRSHERSSHSQQPVPQTTHSYHTVNVVSPHPTGSRISPAGHHASYLYPVHQLVTPVAHVPIGAAHYAHLPPSIWSPPHAQYHHHPHAQPHQMPPPSHHVSPTAVSGPHGQLQYATSHVHHVATPAHPTAHAYAIQPPYTTTAPQHPPPPGPPHAAHPSSHHPQHHITYAYAPIPAPPPPHHPVKGTIAVSPSQPLTIGGPVSYAISASHSPQPMGPPLTSKVTGKNEPLPSHVPHPDHAHSPNLNGVVTSGATVKSYAVRDVIPHANASGTETRTDTSSPRLLSDPALNRDRIHSFAMAAEKRKDATQKEQAQQSDQPIWKPRKPYTMKKSREVWTPEEHNRFLQALQLYDRDWKKIEAYIGTKTVLQIRSHAQKYFGKVTKYKTGEYIPPPRPKKRATLPYPRSRTSGQSKSSSGNGSASDKPAVEENGTHRAMDQIDTTASKSRISATQPPPDAKQESPTLRDTPNDTGHAIAVDSPDKHSKLPVTKPSHVNAVNVNERRSDSVPYTDKYSPTSYDRPNIKREEFANYGNHVQTGSVPRWHSGPLPTEPRREQLVLVANLACASSPDTKPGVNGYRSERYVPPLQNSSCKGDLEQRERQHDREHHRRTRQPATGSENTFAPRQADLPSPNQTCSTQSVEHDSTNEKPMRKKMAMPNNSLLVLSNCVDLMSRDAVPERQPAAGWATAAAARRAHRAKVIRARKPPLPQGSIVMQPEDPENRGKGSPRRNLLNPNMTEGQRHTESGEGVAEKSPPPTGGESSQVASPAEYGSAQPPPDPHRSSAESGTGTDDAIAGFSSSDRPSAAGSGTGSDDAIAGFSSSDRPSVSGSAAGSGTGGSLGTSEAGDPEEDPKSSNDGSGDDGRRSPPTRDSSPADPNSSGSRETSPNEFPLPRSRNQSESGQLSSASPKLPGENRMPAERFDRASHAENPSVECKANRPDASLNRKAHENQRFPGPLLNEEKPAAGGDDHKPRTIAAPMHTKVEEKRMPPLDRLPRINQAAGTHERAVQESSPNSRKRMRVTAEYDAHNRTDHRDVEHNRDSDTKRPRVMHSVKETKYTAEPAYHRQEFTERKR